MAGQVEQAVPRDSRPARDNRKESVMDAAAGLFARHGFHGTSMRDIAKAVGVTPGAIYAHFPSKQALLVAVYRTGVARIAAVTEQTPPRGDGPWERLETVCRAHLAALVGPDPYAKVVIRVLPADAPDVERELIHLRDAYEAGFRAATRELDLDQALDAGLFRLFLLGALNWAQTWYRPGQADVGEIAKQLITVMRSGGRRTIRQGHPVEE